jgi:DNA-binding NarL/FixJ family response regulator
MTVRVVIADDHALVREGLRLILAIERDIEVVGEASSGHAAMQLVATLQPDVVLMDISMPELNGIEATGTITTRGAATRVIILSMHASAEHVYQAFKAGARGYVVKEAAGREVVEAIREVSCGRRYVSPQITADVIEASTGLSGVLPGASPFERLSSRERQVLQLVVEGWTSAAIGEALGLSPKTVETYRSRIMTKLGITNTAQLVKLAVLHGVTDIE